MKSHSLADKVFEKYATVKDICKSHHGERSEIAFLQI
jgi:hypothetical protein